MPISNPTRSIALALLVTPISWFALIFAYRVAPPDGRLSVGLLLMAVGSFVFWLVALGPVRWCARRVRFDRTRWVRAFLFHLAAAMAVSAVLTAAIVGIVWVASGRSALGLSNGGPLGPNSISGLLLATYSRWLPIHVPIYLAIVYGVYADDRQRELRDHELREMQLESDLAQSELRALRMQLQPHFLFNALNAVGVLIREDSESALRTLEQLSSLLRHSLRDMGSGEVPLQSEIEFVEAYLEIQRVRFGEDLSFEVDCADDVRSLPVPPFILQPLVENAVCHGLEPLGGRGHICVRARREGDRLELTVRDDGVGLLGAEPSVVRESGGVGLRVTAERLARLFGDDHGFELRRAEGGGTEAVLSIPRVGRAAA